MISWSSVWAVVIRHLRLFRRDINNLLFVFYWPLLDILTWGFLGTWIQQTQTEKLVHYEMTALLGILLWQFAGRGGNIMAFALCEELWSNNIVNWFSLPLKISEWVCGVIVLYSLVMSMITVVCFAVIAMLYNVSLLSLFLIFLKFLPPLFFSGIWLGFTCLQIVILLGKRGVELGFVVVWFLLPFSGAFYPTDVLPQWGQVISSWLPMSYVFNGIRQHVMYQQSPISYLIRAYVLSMMYAMLAVALFVYCFNRSKQKGLARLVD